MIKRFSFWVVLVVLASIGSMVFIHWKALQEPHSKIAELQPLYQRQKAIDSLNLMLERYRRMSSSFRKMDPGELSQVKDKLKTGFSKTVTQLDQLNPTPDDLNREHQLNDQITELLNQSAHFEAMLFSKDAYIKPEIQDLHEQILGNLSHLEKSNQARLDSLRNGLTRSGSQSSLFLLGVGSVILLMVLGLILRDYFTYGRPLARLHKYAEDLNSGKPVNLSMPRLPGLFGNIQSSMNNLAQTVESQIRDRHKFILDIVADLKSPLALLQSGKFLLAGSRTEMDEEQQAQAADSVRRGLAIFSGSLDDLNDIVDINRLDSHLQEKTVDLSELVSDVVRTLMGAEASRRVTVVVPPMPVWTQLDARRFERAFIQVISKVANTLPKGGTLAVAISQLNQGSFRGVEISIQDAERLKSGRVAAGGPEQDLVKHWISETGLSMALVHKIVKAHGGTVTAAGVAGTSVTVNIRIPQERVVVRGLISPPTSSEEAGVGLRGLEVSPQISGSRKSQHTTTI